MKQTTKLVSTKFPVSTIEHISMNKDELIVIHNHILPPNKTTIPEKGHPFSFNSHVINQFKHMLNVMKLRSKWYKRKSVRAKAARLIETVINIMNDKLEEIKEE